MSLFAATAVLALQSASLATSPVDPASAEARAVLVPIEATFAALAARDSALLTPHLDPEARMTVALAGADGQTTIRRLTGQAFAEGLRPGPEQLDEVMPDPIVAIDGDVAMVFGRYLFRVDGVISHCGANHFDMVRRDGAWKIAGITWSQRTTGCE